MDLEKLQETTQKLADTFGAAAAMMKRTGRGAHIEVGLLLDDACSILDQLIELDPDPDMKGAYRTERRHLRAMPSAAKFEKLAIEYAGLAGSDPRDDLAADVFVEAILFADVCLVCGADKVSTHCVLCGTDHTIHG